MSNSSFLVSLLGSMPRSKKIMALNRRLKMDLDYEKEYEDLVSLTKEICTIIRDVLKEKGLTLYDIKLEFGKVDGEVVLIDEISGGNMRVYNGDKIVAPTDLYSFLLK